MFANRWLQRSLIRWMFALATVFHLGCEAGALSATQPKYPMEGFDVAILKDASARLSVEDLERPELAARFVPLNGTPKLGYATEVVWLRLRLQRLEEAPPTWLLEYSNPFVNDLRLYARSATGFTVAQAGDQFPFAERALKFHHPVFALPFPDTSQQTFYVRLDSDSSLAGEWVLWQPDALRDKAQHELFYFGAVLGMISMSFLISIIHGLYTRERKILLFSMLTVNVFFIVASGVGLVAQFLTPTLPMVADLVVPWSLAFSTVSMGVVFGNALRIPADFPRVNQGFKLAYGLALAAPFTRWLHLYNVWGGPLLQMVSLGVVCCTGWVSWVRWRSNTKGAGYYLAAHLVVIGSAFAGRMVLMGLLPSNSFTQLSWIPGLLAFIFLVHAGIFVDWQSLKGERDAALADIQIADEVLARERTLRAQQTAFFSFVAHELRSPLAAVITGVKNLENEWPGAPQQALGRTRRIKAYAERMGSLIDRHLTLQRLSNADFAPRFSLTQPRHIAEESLRHAQALFVGRVFEPDYAAGLPAVAALDQELVRMGLENLLINAAKYSPDSGAIALDVFADTALHFRVRDSGPGIRPEQRSRLSALFNRMQQTSFKDGFGIGLAIARRVAHAHGGSLDYADRAGGGAVFTLSLPLRQ